MLELFLSLFSLQNELFLVYNQRGFGVRHFNILKATYSNVRQVQHK